MQFKYRRLEETSNYLVYDKEEKEYATFCLIDAPHLRPEPGCKFMELKINQEIVAGIIAGIIERVDLVLLHEIFVFVFDSVLEITHELKGYRLCKIYSKDAKVAMFYKNLAKKLSEQKYSVKMYGRWIEIRKK